MRKLFIAIVSGLLLAGCTTGVPTPRVVKPAPAPSSPTATRQTPACEGLLRIIFATPTTTPNGVVRIGATLIDDYIISPTPKSATPVGENTTVTMSIGSSDPGASNKKPIGTKSYTFASIKANVGSRDAFFGQLWLAAAGSATEKDLDNVVIRADVYQKSELQETTVYPAIVQRGQKGIQEYGVLFQKGIVVPKGGAIEFSIDGDVVGGTGRTVQMNIDRKSDIVVFDADSAERICVGGGAPGPASAGGFSSSEKPLFRGYTTTIL